VCVLTRDRETHTYTHTHIQTYTHTHTKHTHTHYAHTTGPTGKVIQAIKFEAPQHAALPLIQIVTNHLRERTIASQSTAGAGEDSGGGGGRDPGGRAGGEGEEVGTESEGEGGVGGGGGGERGDFVLSAAERTSISGASVSGASVSGVSLSGAGNAVRTAAVLDSVLNGYYGGRSDDFWARPDKWPGRL